MHLTHTSAPGGPIIPMEPRSELRLSGQQPAPISQVMHVQVNEFEDDDPIRGVFPERVNDVRRILASDKSLFKPGPSSCRKRSKDMYQFSTCYACDAQSCLSGAETNCCSTLLIAPLKLAAMVIAGVVDVGCMVGQCPPATAYVCCNAEPAGKCYRGRHEAIVYEIFGLRRK